MSLDVWCSVQRAGQLVQTGVYCQVDQMSPLEAAESGGESPFLSYEVYLLAAQDLRPGDLLVDPARIDPFTGQPTRYRIKSMPEVFPDGHMELIAERLIGPA